jgi:rare lipoprotein A
MTTYIGRREFIAALGGAATWPLFRRFHLRNSFILFAVSIIIFQALPEKVAFAQSGVASVYSTKSGSGTASGQRLNPDALTAAHRSLPFGTKVRVTNRNNGHSVIVTINDRGPFVRGRIVDVTPAAARALGFSGLAPVTVEPLLPNEAIK